MATYKPRPDGLVDVTYAPGQPALPMTEDQAKMGGATPETPSPLAMGMPTPPSGPNPYSMIGSGEATAQLAKNTQASMADAQATQAAVSPAAALSPTAPPPKTKEQELDDSVFGGAGDFVTSMGRKINRFLTRPVGSGPDIEAAQRRWDAEHAGQGEAPKAEESKPAEAKKEGAKPAAPSASAQQETGGFQLGGPITISGGGLNLAERTTRSGIRLDPGYKRVAEGLSPEAERDEYKAGAKKIYDEQQEAIRAEQIWNDKQEIENAERKQQIAQNRAKLQERLDLIDKREQEAAKATPQSRDEIMSSRPALARMFSALSVIMGARYQGLTGRNNPGMDMLNQSIADEIAGQRAKYEAAKDKVSMANTDFGKAMLLYGDPNAAEADLNMRANTLAASIIRNHWKKPETEIDLLARNQTADELMKKAAEYKQTAATLQQGQVVTTERKEAPTVQGLLDDKQMARLVHVDGYGDGFVSNPVQQPEFQKRATAATTAIKIFDQLESLQPTGGFVANDPDTLSNINAWRQAALSAISEAEGQGIVTKDDAEKAKAILNDPYKIMGSGTAALKATRAAMALKLDEMVGSTMFADPHSRSRMPRKRADSFKPGIQ